MILCYADVDNDKIQDVCKEHGVSCMPTLVAVKDGKQVGKMEGVNQGQYEKWCAGEF